jgi:hypothetical protein
LVAAILIWEEQRVGRLQAELGILGAQIATAEFDWKEKGRVAEQSKVAEQQSEANASELIRLRALVTTMREQENA